MRNRLEGYKPVGHLAALCTEYQAPRVVQAQLARRAGTIIGTPVFPTSKVEGTIQESMSDNRGIPDWDKVTTLVATEVRDIYRKMKR